ncbi:hypothetical protein Mapa_005538 [Marchantia paleacea]|nr:hypothetical protein Mapa_005538 [Marchantia paleacea]
MAGAAARVRLNFGLLAMVTWIMCSCSGSSAEKDCTPEFTSLGTCLRFVTNADVAPPTACCTSLTSVYNSAPICLCQLAAAGGPSDSIPDFNITRALELPALCNVPAAGSNCAVAAPPVVPPASSAQIVSISGAFTLLSTIAAILCLLRLH